MRSSLAENARTSLHLSDEKPQPTGHQCAPTAPLPSPRTTALLCSDCAEHPAQALALAVPSHPSSESPVSEAFPTHPDQLDQSEALPSTSALLSGSIHPRAHRCRLLVSSRESCRTKASPSWPLSQVLWSRGGDRTWEQDGLYANATPSTQGDICAELLTALWSLNPTKHTQPPHIWRRGPECS